MHFLGNGDGLVTSLNGKKAKCNLLFAVHTVKSEQNEFGITDVKEGRVILCDVAMTFNKLENLSLIYSFTSFKKRKSRLTSPRNSPVHINRFYEYKSAASCQQA